MYIYFINKYNACEVLHFYIRVFKTEFYFFYNS